MRVETRETQTEIERLFLFLMAPKKRRGVQEKPEESELPVRVTRGAAKRAANTISADLEAEVPKPELPPKKRTKKAEKEERRGKESSEAAETKTIVIEHW